VLLVEGILIGKEKRMKRLAMKCAMLLCILGIIPGCTSGNQAPQGAPSSGTRTPLITADPAPQKKPESNPAPTTVRLSPPPNSKPVANLFDFKPLKQASSRQELLDHFGRVSAECTDLTVGGSHLLCFIYDVGSGIYIYKGFIYLQDGDKWLLADKMPIENGVYNPAVAFQIMPVGSTAIRVSAEEIVVKNPHPSGSSQSATPSKNTSPRVIANIRLSTLKEHAQHPDSSH
jgi:hypothetical protein